MPSTSNPFFIIGSARSGTTLLRLMLNAHREVVVPPESRFITELWKGEPEIEVQTFLDALARHKRFETWDLPLGAVRREIADEELVPYADAIEAAYQAYARLHGKSRWGDKTPRYIMDIPLLNELFPRAQFVHLIRDGRNVALSYADVPFGPKTVTSAAALWAKRVRAGCAAGRGLPAGRYIEIRYEDLVEDAAGEAKDLCEFLGLEFDPGMLDYTEGARDAVLTRAAQFNPHVTERPIAQTRSWEQDMTDDQVELFEAVAGDVLSQLGYERRHPSPGRSARVKAALGKRGVPIGRLSG